MIISSIRQASRRPLKSHCSRKLVEATCRWTSAKPCANEFRYSGKQYTATRYLSTKSAEGDKTQLVTENDERKVEKPVGKRKDNTPEAIARALRKSQRKTTEELKELRKDPNWPPSKENKIFQLLKQESPITAADFWDKIKDLDIVESKTKMKFFLQRLKQSRKVVTTKGETKSFIYAVAPPKSGKKKDVMD